MINYRFYIYTTLGIVLFFLLTIILATPFLTKSNTITLLDNQIESSIKEARQISTLSSYAIKNGLPKDTVISAIQTSIENTEQESTFISVLNWSGKHVCYPDKTKIGTQIPENPKISSFEKAITGSAFYESFIKNKVASKTQRTSEVVYLHSITNSDWIIACHVNTNALINKIKALRSQIHSIFLIIGLIMLLFILATIRLISNYYERQLAFKTSQLEDGVLNLSKLNSSLENYQKNLFQLKDSSKNTLEVTEYEEEISNTKERILTYVRNELLPISINDIAYIYVENTITYIVRKDGKRTTSNESLDQIYTYLDETSFFRANRQIIVAISAIDKIIKFGNSKLKIEIHQNSEIDIIIGKNKASAFKQWLEL